jgi:hypothetical protein
MRFLVFSPKDRIIRVTQFASANMDAPTARPRSVISENHLSSCGLSDLERRCTAPLRLSMALLSRLPRRHPV